jgi:hypothetical protein
MDEGLLLSNLILSTLFPSNLSALDLDFAANLLFFPKKTHKTREKVKNFYIFPP